MIGLVVGVAVILLFILVIILGVLVQTYQTRVKELESRIQVFAEQHREDSYEMGKLATVASQLRHELDSINAPTEEEMAEVLKSLGVSPKKPGTMSKKSGRKAS